MSILEESNSRWSSIRPCYISRMLLSPSVVSCTSGSGHFLLMADSHTMMRADQFVIARGSVLELVKHDTSDMLVSLCVQDVFAPVIALDVLRSKTSNSGDIVVVLSLSNGVGSTNLQSDTSKVCCVRLSLIALEMLDNGNIRFVLLHSMSVALPLNSRHSNDHSMDTYNKLCIECRGRAAAVSLPSSDCICVFILQAYLMPCTDVLSDRIFVKAGSHVLAMNFLDTSSSSNLKDCVFLAVLLNEESSLTVVLIVYRINFGRKKTPNCGSKDVPERESSRVHVVCEISLPPEFHNDQSVAFFLFPNVSWTIGLVQAGVVALCYFDQESSLKRLYPRWEILRNSAIPSIISWGTSGLELDASVYGVSYDGQVCQFTYSGMIGKRIHQTSTSLSKRFRFSVRMCVNRIHVHLIATGIVVLPDGFLAVCDGTGRGVFFVLPEYWARINNEMDPVETNGTHIVRGCFGGGLAPIRALCNISSLKDDNTAPMVACCGLDNDGSLVKFQFGRSMKLLHGSSAQFTGAENIWALTSNVTRHLLVVVSFDDASSESTVVFVNTTHETCCADENIPMNDNATIGLDYQLSLQDWTEISGFKSDERTLHTATTSIDHVLVQITRSCVVIAIPAPVCNHGKRHNNNDYNKGKFMTASKIACTKYCPLPKALNVAAVDVFDDHDYTSAGWCSDWIPRDGMYIDVATSQGSLIVIGQSLGNGCRGHVGGNNEIVVLRIIDNMKSKSSGYTSLHEAPAELKMISLVHLDAEPSYLHIPLNFCWFAYNSDCINDTTVRNSDEQEPICCIVSLIISGVSSLRIISLRSTDCLKTLQELPLIDSERCDEEFRNETVVQSMQSIVVMPEKGTSGSILILGTRGGIVIEMEMQWDYVRFSPYLRAIARPTRLSTSQLSVVPFNQEKLLILGHNGPWLVNASPYFMYESRKVEYLHLQLPRCSVSAINQGVQCGTVLSEFSSMDTDSTCIFIVDGALLFLKLTQLRVIAPTPFVKAPGCRFISFHSRACCFIVTCHVPNSDFDEIRLINSTFGDTLIKLTFKRYENVCTVSFFESLEIPLIYAARRSLFLVGTSSICESPIASDKHRSMFSGTLYLYAINTSTSCTSNFTTSKPVSTLCEISIRHGIPLCSLWYYARYVIVCFSDFCVRIYAVEEKEEAIDLRVVAVLQLPDYFVDTVCSSHMMTSEPHSTFELTNASLTWSGEANATTVYLYVLLNGYSCAIININMDNVLHGSPETAFSKWYMHRWHNAEYFQNLSLRSTVTRVFHTSPLLKSNVLVTPRGHCMATQQGYIATPTTYSTPLSIDDFGINGYEWRYSNIASSITDLISSTLTVKSINDKKSNISFQVAFSSGAVLDLREIEQGNVNIKLLQAVQAVLSEKESGSQLRGLCVLGQPMDTSGDLLDQFFLLDECEIARIIPHIASMGLSANLEDVKSMLSV